MVSIQAHVCILGGGPAGAAAARRLALLGHSVVIVEKAVFPRQGLGESLSGSVLPLLVALGLRDAVEAEAFLRPRSAIVRWNGEDEIRELPSPSGFHVDRARFNEILFLAARSAGVQVHRPARLIGYSQDGNEGLAIEVRTGEGRDVRIHCAFAIDAMGRGSSLAGRMNRMGQPTMALSAFWRGTAPVKHNAVIEACPSGWLWGAALTDNLQHAAAFVDTCDLRKGLAESAPLDNLYNRLVASSRLLSDWISGTQVTKVQVCDATPFWCERPVQNRVIKVGDASMSIDPLAAHGVQVALGSALHAAAMIHTILNRPSDAGIAEQFYVERQRRSIAFHTRAAASLYADAAQVYPTPFWLTRAARINPSVESRGVGVAWKPDTLVRVHPLLRFLETPVIKGDFIVGARGISVPGLQEFVVFVDSVPIEPLLTTISGTMQCSEIVRAWSYSIPPPQGIRILNHMLQHDILQVSPTARP